MSTKQHSQTNKNETFNTPIAARTIDDDLQETREYRSILFASEKQVEKVGSLLHPEEKKSNQHESRLKDDATFASEVLEDIIPEYYIAQERRMNNAHWMCRYYAHHITCPNEDLKMGKECFNQHCPKIRQAHDAILHAQKMG